MPTNLIRSCATVVKRLQNPQPEGGQVSSLISKPYKTTDKDEGGLLAHERQLSPDTNFSTPTFVPVSARLKPPAKFKGRHCLGSGRQQTQLDSLEDPSEKGKGRLPTQYKPAPNLLANYLPNRH